MKIAVISDIHANFEAIKVLDGFLKNADTVICLGDLTGYYCQVNEVVDYIRDLGAYCVMGNHDYFVLHGCPPHLPLAVTFGVQFADSVIHANNRHWLAQLPLVWSSCFAGITILMSHGSPWNPLEDYLYANNPKLAGLAEFQYDVIAFGQTHRTFVQTSKRPFLLNPGSVGQPRDTNKQASMLLLDTTTMMVEQIRQPFDAEAVVRLAEQNGAQDWIGKHMQ